MTTIPAVKAALVALVEATLPDTQPIYGPISSVTTTGPRVLAIGNVIGTRELDSLSLSSTVERYTVDLAVSVDYVGTDQQSASNAALSDYEEMVDAILADITLGVPGVLQVLPTATFELREQADSDGRHAAVLFAVSVTAQN
jgi:hypothetical protein